MTKLNALQETVDKRNPRVIARAETQKLVDDNAKNYSSVNITNAVEEVLIDHGYCEKGSYECNSFLMDVLEKLGHYKGGK